MVIVINRTLITETILLDTIIVILGGNLYKVTVNHISDMQ